MRVQLGVLVQYYQVPIPWTLCARDGLCGCGERREQSIQTGDENQGGKFGAGGEKMRTEGVESVERQLPTEKPVPEFGMNFAETVLQMASTGAQKQDENNIQLILTLSLTRGSFIDT